MALAVFPGSFDPFHLGHLAIVEWAAATYDEVIVAVASNPEKPVAFLTQDDRVRLASLATRHLGNVRCLAVHGATGTVANEQGADVIIRSAHKEADLERSLAVLNKFMSGGIPTEFAPSDPATEAISSTTVRELLASGEVEAALELIPPAMRDELRATAPAGRPLPPTPATPGPMTLGRRVQPVRIAAVQDGPVLMDRDATLDRALTLTAAAAAAGAGVVVFPETFLPGYPDWVGRTRPGDDLAAAWHAALFDNAVVIGSAVTQILGVAAKRFGIYLSIGIDEREPAGPTLYNTQLLFGPDGALLSVHRKLVPTGGERLVWGSGGGSGLKVVETPFGRIGTLTGSETYLALARAVLYAQGVDLFLAPTWGNSEVWPATLQHVAIEGSVFVVGVNQYLQASDVPDSLPGRQQLYTDDGEYLARGTSMIVDPTGHVVAGPLVEQAGIVVADVDVNEARHQRHRFDLSGQQRHPELLRLLVDMMAAPSETATPGYPVG